MESIQSIQIYSVDTTGTISTLTIPIVAADVEKNLETMIIGMSCLSYLAYTD